MFIKSIKFPEGHPFYNNGKIIEFGDKQKDLIDFYLKTTKKIKEGDENNIQINCILGDNGAGKSRFLKLLQPNDRDDNEDRVEIKFSGKNKYKGAKVIFDDFHNISSNSGYSIHSSLFEKYQKSKSLESIYLQIQGFIEKDSTIKSIFRDFLNLEENFKSNLFLKPNYEWYNDFGGSHIEFIETDSKEGLDNFINKRLYQDREGEWDKKDLLSIFQFLYTKSSNQRRKEFHNLNKIISREVAFEYWLLLSDLFISLLNEFRNGIDFIINTPEENFIKLKNYNEFKEILGYLLYFLQENRGKIEVIKEKIHRELSQDYFIGTEDILTYYDNSISSIKYLLQIFNELEKNEEAEESNLAKAKKLSEEYFGLSLHELLRHISGYEKSHVYANDYFIVELAMKFSNGRITKKFEEKVARTLQWIFYYIFRNPIQEKVRYKQDNYKINFDGTYNFSNKEYVILRFPLFKQYFEFTDKNGTKSIEQLSGGEKALLLRFSKIYISILENLSSIRNFIILIDEPDLHLHLDWQRQYIQKLIDVFSTLPKDITTHFIIATHSPFIVSDLPGENIIRMRKDDGAITFQNYGEGEKDKKTSFGANYIDIIQEGFFDNRLLMGSFAEEVITNLAITEKIKLSKELLGDSYRSNESYKRIENYMLEGVERIEQAKNQIGDTFLKNYLLYFKTNENNSNS